MSKNVVEKSYFVVNYFAVNVFSVKTLVEFHNFFQDLFFGNVFSVFMKSRWFLPREFHPVHENVLPVEFIVRK